MVGPPRAGRGALPKRERGEGGGCLAKFASGAVLPRLRIEIKLPPPQSSALLGGGNYHYPAKGRMQVS
jgi:hypothetical protein